MRRAISSPHTVRVSSRAAAAAIGVAAAVLLVASGGCGGSGGSAEEATSTAAKPLPSAHLFVAPDGSDQGTGDRDQPLRTLEAAHAAAAPGDIVEVAGGDYPVQDWTAPARGPTDPVVFQAAPGEEPRFAYLRLRDVDDVELRDVATEGWYIDSGSERVTLREVRSSVNGNFITSASDVAVIGGTIGPVDSSDGIQVKRAEGLPNPRRILIDGLRMSDITRRAEPDRHVDCIQFGAGEEVVITGARFDGCATQGVFLRPFGGGVIRDVLIENNWFGSVPEGFSGLIVDEDVGPGAGVVVRYNSSLTGMRIEPEGAQVVANIAPLEQASCRDGVVYRTNLWSQARCDGSDHAGDPAFVDAAALDLRLGPSSPAIDRADPADATARDIEGTTRPRGDAPDIGAWEAP